MFGDVTDRFAEAASNREQREFGGEVLVGGGGRRGGRRRQRTDRHVADEQCAGSVGCRSEATQCIIDLEWQALAGGLGHVDQALVDVGGARVVEHPSGSAHGRLEHTCQQYRRNGTLSTTPVGVP